MGDESTTYSLRFDGNFPILRVDCVPFKKRLRIVFLLLFNVLDLSTLVITLRGFGKLVDDEEGPNKFRGQEAEVRGAQALSPVSRPDSRQ